MISATIASRISCLSKSGAWSRHVVVIKAVSPPMARFWKCLCLGRMVGIMQDVLAGGEYRAGIGLRPASFMPPSRPRVEALAHDL